MPINDDGDIVEDDSGNPLMIHDAPKGIYCPYCNIRESNRTTIINKRLKWVCDVCLKEIIDYEQRHRR